MSKFGNLLESDNDPASNEAEKLLAAAGIKNLRITSVAGYSGPFVSIGNIINDLQAKGVVDCLKRSGKYKKVEVSSGSQTVSGKPAVKAYHK